MYNQPEYYEREKLYKEVWAEPAIKVAKRYGVSYVYIARICRKMKIPLPGRGYWAKAKSGQKLKQTPLPKFKDCPKIKRLKHPYENLIIYKPSTRIAIPAKSVSHNFFLQYVNYGLGII